MSLEYKEIEINGYVNTTDKFGLLIGYTMVLGQPLISGLNRTQIIVYDQLKNPVDLASITVNDNGLTQTYFQLQASNGNPKSLLIPPGYSLGVIVNNGIVSPYGMLLLGTLDEIARVAIR